MTKNKTTLLQKHPLWYDLFDCIPSVTPTPPIITPLRRSIRLSPNKTQLFLVLFPYNLTIIVNIQTGRFQSTYVAGEMFLADLHFALNGTELLSLFIDWQIFITLNRCPPVALQIAQVIISCIKWQVNQCPVSLRCWRLSRNGLAECMNKVVIT